MPATVHSGVPIYVEGALDLLLERAMVAIASVVGPDATCRASHEKLEIELSQGRRSACLRLIAVAPGTTWVALLQDGTTRTWSPPNSLTTRERQVMHLATVERRTLKQIAVELGLQIGTVRTFHRNALAKIDGAAHDPARSDSRQGPTLSDALTARERQVADLVQEGLSNPEIGARLALSPVTVGSHLSRIYRKLGVAGRYGLLLRMQASPARNPSD